MLENSNYEAPENTEAIMVLSASPPSWSADRSKAEEDYPEDVERIKFGIEVYKNFISRKLKKPIAELTTEDLQNETLPPLVLKGATEQLPMLERIARSLDFPREKIIFINCGDHAVANTKTQFAQTVAHPIVGKFKHLTLISTSYHVPRLARTASKNLPEDVDFDVLGVPLEDFSFDVYRKVKGEVKRIIEYSRKGDIAKHPRGKEQLDGTDIKMGRMPDWHSEPSTPLWEKWGETIPKVIVKHVEREVKLPTDQHPELKDRRAKLVEGEHNFNGALANVEGVSISPSGVEIETSTVRFFDYMAASSYFREKNLQKESPIRPLATQAVLLTPDNEIIFTRRPPQLFDFPGALSEFGGALKPEQTDVTAGIMAILQKKLGLKLDRDQLEITGIDRENVNNIFCVFYLVRLTEEQAKDLMKRLRGVQRDTSEVFYKVSADQSLQYFERLFQHRPINSWNPTAYINILYALAASKLRSSAEILRLLEKTKESLKEEPFKYE